jgi:hypothetical protein
MEQPEQRLKDALHYWIKDDLAAAEAIDTLFAPDMLPAVKELFEARMYGKLDYCNIYIPNFRPAALNEFRGSKASRHIEGAAKDDMIKLINAYAKNERVRRVSDDWRMVRRIVLTVWYGKGQRRHDKDAFDKVAKDACKRAGLIVDDSLQWVDWSVELKQDRELPYTHATQIELWDLRLGDAKRQQRKAA